MAQLQLKDIIPLLPILAMNVESPIQYGERSGLEET